MHTTSTRRRLGAGAVIAGLVFLALGALAPSAHASHVTGTPYSDNPSCADLGYPFEFKLEGWSDGGPDEGDYTDGSGGEFKSNDNSPAPDGLTVTIDNVDVDDAAKTVTFDWEASTDDGPLAIQVLLVKVANGGLRYDYSPAVSEDDGVVSPRDSVSHLSFCWGGEEQVEETTTTETPTTEAVTPTTEGSDVAGEVITAPQELPRTGQNDRTLFLIGMGLITIGAISMIARRELLVRS